MLASQILTFLDSLETQKSKYLEKERIFFSQKRKKKIIHYTSAFRKTFCMFL